MANLTCIMCPMGCSIQISKGAKGELVVTGNNCIRGEQFAKEEIVAPKRVVTSLLKTNKGVVPVKTTKKYIAKTIQEIEKLKIDNVKFHQVVIKNIFNSGADVIVTGKVTNKK